MSTPSLHELARQVSAQASQIAALRRQVRDLEAKVAQAGSDVPLDSRPRVLDHSSADDFEELPDGSFRPLRARSTT